MPEQTLQTALDLVTDGFIAFDPEWRFRWVNRTTAEYFRRPREALLGHVVWELFPVSEATDAKAKMLAAAAGDAPSEFEVFTPVMQRWVRFRCFPSPEGLTVYFTDVTEARARERAHEEALIQYRSLFENSLNGVLLTAPTGEVFAANPAACALLQRTEEELRAGGRNGVVDHGDRRLQAALEERKRTGKAIAEFRLVRKDGTTFPALVASAIFRLPDGTERTCLTFQDLSERLRSEERLRFAARAGAELSASLNLAETVQTVQRLAVPFLADHCNLVLEDPSSSAWPDARWRAAAMRVYRTGTPEPLSDEAVILPLTARGKQGGVLTLSGRRFDPSDVAMALSFAGRVALAVENCRLFETIVESRRLREEVLGIVSHDLRAPLNTISLSAGLIHSRAPAVEVESIVRAVERANRLIEDLLITAQIDNGELRLVRERVAVGTLIDEVIQLHAPVARSVEVELLHEPGDDQAEALLDAHRVVQLLSNLVSNAIKFTAPHGSVRVSARAQGGEVRFTVEDTGRGIPPEQLAHIWDRFWQAAHARKAGVGLGLAIVRGIVEAHGGTVEVHSVVDHGSTFTCVLPTRISGTLSDPHPYP